MKDGTTRFNPPLLSPDIIEPAGPIDPQVGIITFTKPGGKGPSSAIVSFAMHPDTTGGTLYSADYIAALDKRMKEAFGAKFTTLFGTGTCGDINHRDVHSKTQRNADILGKMLGDTVVSAIQKGELSSIKQPSLAMRSTKVTAPLQSYSPAEVAKAKENMSRLGTPGLPFMTAAEVVQDRRYRAFEEARRPAASGSAGDSPERRYGDRHVAVGDFC